MTSNDSLESPPSTLIELPPEGVIFGRSPAMSVIRESVARTANTNIPLLLQGESGTGKEILARFIHQRSPWGNGPFVKVNCPAIPGTLLESELFGYEKGAFTGAYGTKPGRVELAHRGTLFLDEIAELDPALQAKLLQVLQDGQFCRIGAQGERQVEVRVICATNRQLQQAVESGALRQDLYYRINVVTIQLPPLRERLQDIAMLASYFLETYSRKYGCPRRPLPVRFLTNLQRYQWPGNIRELENLMKRYVILGSEEEMIGPLENGDSGGLNVEIPREGVISLKKAVRQAAKELERKIILRVLEAHRWNRKMAARALRISYTALLYKMREAGVPPLRGPRARRQAGADPDDWLN